MMDKSVRIGNAVGSVISTGITRDISVNNKAHSEPKQTLAEAAEEIQQLLEQLEKTNPQATEPQQVAYIDIVKPDLKKRAVAALKEGGETAIEEFFLENKYLKVVKAVVKGWLNASS